MLEGTFIQEMKCKPEVYGKLMQEKIEVVVCSSKNEVLTPLASEKVLTPLNSRKALTPLTSEILLPHMASPSFSRLNQF